MITCNMGSKSYENIELASDEKRNEKEDILCPNAIVHPGAMVIKNSNAFATIIAMF